MKLLFVGDIVAKAGRELLLKAIGPLLDRHGIDLVVANVENVAGGFGVTRELCEALLKAGVAVMTSGNHIWDKKEALDYIANEPRLLRPANYPAGVPGHGRFVATTPAGDKVGVLNAMGRVFMLPIDDPFATLTREIEIIRAQTRVIIVDFHAEATSEKIAMGWFLDGKVTAVVGTHTHVQTADEQILPGGTAYITDVGMTGPHDSVIGIEKDAAIGRFLNALPTRFEAASGNPRLNAVVVTADLRTGKATAIERLSLSSRDVEALTDRTVSTQ